MDPKVTGSTPVGHPTAVINHADHREWDKYADADVRDMYTGVTRFMAERLG